MAKAPLKPSHRTVQAYYDTLAQFGDQHVEHEGAVRSAFQTLLADTARAHGWTLIPELSSKTAPGGVGVPPGGVGVPPASSTIRPDGTIRDANSLPRGYWEAKDTSDDLDAEIVKKAAKGYSLVNTIFEDTHTAVLFQGKREVLRVDLREPQQLCDLLTQFYAYTEPDIADFEQAIDEFKQRVPELARGLADIIRDSHNSNPKFQAAFDQFFTLCQSALNPNIARAAVDEMLIQHLLTERLIRKVFDNPEFTQRNVIAAEVEKVIAALVSRSFNRDEFLRSLDRFYVAIEHAARRCTDWNEKQHFLNTVYERFFQGYSVKLADTHGIVYTPQPIVDFMCASVAEVLQTEFGVALTDKSVQILDPCTGTGNFIVNLLRRMPQRDLPRMYKAQLFANEVMLLPYYIAALNIEHAYYELTGTYEPFEGLCFVDTLDMPEIKQKGFEFFTEANTERVKRQKKAPIKVVIGNPPYNVGQLNENDNNKNRTYKFIDSRIAQTYAKASAATNKKALSDMYVKFFRWAADRLQERDGIVCFVSNNSFVDQIAFDGMRKHMLKDFTRIYHLHLEGNVRHNPTLPGTTYNVFGIQVGVGITVAIRCAAHKDRQIQFHRVDKLLRREEKLAWLSEHADISLVEWQRLTPDRDNLWLHTENAGEFGLFAPIGARTTSPPSPGGLFKAHSRGLETTRDTWVYDFAPPPLMSKVKRLVETYNAELDRWRRQGEPRDIDRFVTTDESKIKWSSGIKEHFRRRTYAAYKDVRVRTALYRPFTRAFVYFDPVLVHRPGMFAVAFPGAAAERDNRLIALSDLGSEKPFMVLISASIADLHLVGAGSAGQCFPFYVYDEDGSNRRENITDWGLTLFREHYHDDTITKWDIFCYVYGVLHHPGYRQKFADNLKRELPRIPLAPPLPPSEISNLKSSVRSPSSLRRSVASSPASGFWAFSAAGKELAHWHLDYEQIEPHKLQFVEKRTIGPNAPNQSPTRKRGASAALQGATRTIDDLYRVEDKMRLSKDKTSLIVNPLLTLEGIPAAVFEYRLGNRSALDWVIDQYQVTTDKRSAIRSDPNRPDDPEYIVRLVGQVVRVSLETVRIVCGLPERYTE